ncbi:MAG: sulfatase [Planctomycetota bacterium]
MIRRTTWLLCVWILAPIVSAQDAIPHPNVVLILVDDLGLHDLSVEGSTFYRTPNIDGLAASGVRFTNGYANCQVCSPSRASLMLGQFPARHGITDWIGAAWGDNWKRGDALRPAKYVDRLPADETTLAEALTAAGYRTFFAGKWHLGGEGSSPTDHGFEINLGGHHRGSPPGGYFSPYRNPVLEDGPDGECLTRRLARDTASFIQEQSRAPEPYFAMLSFYAVHGPIQTTESLWQKYRELALDAIEGERFIIDRTLPVRQVQDNPIYAGMMETLDDAVGDVLAAIDASGQAEDTIVIFTADNGGVSSGDAFATCNLPLRGGKGRQWEGGIREPYYIRFPRLTRAGAHSDVPVTGADLFPTVLDLAGLPLMPQNHQDGRSLKALLADPMTPVDWSERPLVWHYPHYGNQGGEPSAILRLGDYKLIHYYLDRHDELYHLPSDVGETHDLAMEQPDRVESMRKTLMDYLSSVNARFPEPDPNYDAAADRLRWKKTHTERKRSLERRAAAYLESDWQPNDTWWGSTFD